MDGGSVASRAHVFAMLELRPNCECCDRDLPPAATDAVICSYECTFCQKCATEVYGGTCPNCAGNFVPRPIRPALALRKNPPSRMRVLRGYPVATVGT